MITITDRAKQLIAEILQSGRISNGKYVREFEQRFAELIGREFAVAVSSGTDAIALALSVLYDYGAQRGDEIIVPALSFVSTGNAVLQAGFTPVFVDIERETLNINPALIETSITGKTRAILPVHLMGKPANMFAIWDIAAPLGLTVIEDAAEAYGARYDGRLTGRWGGMATFSTYIAHVISTGEGGVVVTDNPRYAEILRSLRSHGRACVCESCLLNSASGYCPKRFIDGQDIRFVHERIGFSAKMNELEAAIGLGTLDIFLDILTKRQFNLRYLREKFHQFSDRLVTIEPEVLETTGPHAFPIIVQEEAGFTRDELALYLEQNGIETRSLFASMPTQCTGFKFLGYQLGDFPEAEYIGNNGFHVGVHQDLTTEHLDYFIETVEKFLSCKV